MKSVKESLLERRSIRRYERQPIEPEKLDFIYEAIRNAPTSYNGQQFSVIAVTDQALKEQLYEITGQKQIKTSAVFMVFCMDFHKLRLAAKQKGVDTPAFDATIDGYTVGVIDASLAMMSAVTAAESLGLGCCCVGYIRTADPEKVSQMLALPRGVSIVCGLAVGYPREKPDLKPITGIAPMTGCCRCSIVMTRRSPNSTVAVRATVPTTTGPATSPIITAIRWNIRSGNTLSGKSV